MCRRGFGPEVAIERVQELSGGTVNSTYLIQFARPAWTGLDKVILRVAPPIQTDSFWGRIDPMRREYQIQPYFASIAHLMPRVIMSDFTRQLIAGDYMLQTWVEGERWSDIEDELPDVESDRLWRQFGSILHTIHATQGMRFGWPHAEYSFAHWSELILDQLEGTLTELACGRKQELSG
jgi:aminoglycoside phosphotransferase (APT) family kinase protein